MMFCVMMRRSIQRRGELFYLSFCLAHGKPMKPMDGMSLVDAIIVD
jgi:hypothetical protein